MSSPLLAEQYKSSDLKKTFLLYRYLNYHKQLSGNESLQSKGDSEYNQEKTEDGFTLVQYPPNDDADC